MSTTPTSLEQYILTPEYACFNLEVLLQAYT
jgi:hypothetical protein